MNVIHKAWRWHFWAAAIVVALSVFKFSLKEHRQAFNRFLIGNALVAVLSVWLRAARVLFSPAAQPAAALGH